MTWGNNKMKAYEKKKTAHKSLDSLKEMAMEWPHIMEAEYFHHKTGTPVEPTWKKKTMETG